MSFLDNWVERGRTALAADQAMVAKLTDVAGDLAVNLTIAALTLAGAVFVSRWASRGVHAGLSRLRATRNDKTIPDFFAQVVRWAILIIGMVMVLQRLGVQTTSIIAVLGAASLAVGLALQGTLSNVAAGVMLLVLRPYRVGDTLEMQGQVGRVKRLDLFNTEIATADNRKVVVPNSKALSDVVVNRTGYPTRRIEIDVDVHYDTDLDHAFQVMRRTAAAQDRVLADPAIWTGLTALKDSSMLVTLHAWVKAADWWEMKAVLLRAVKEAFDRERVVMPYPHQVSVLDPSELRDQLQEATEPGDGERRAN